MGALARFYFQCRPDAAECAERAEIIERGIGSVKFRFVFLSEILAPLLAPPMAHLGATAGAPDFTVFIRENKIPASPRPPVPWPRVACERDGAERCLAGNFEAFVEGPADSLSVIDHASAEAVFWPRDTALPLYEVCAPMRTIVRAGLARQGIQLLHGAAVGTERGALLLAGRGGVGKTTTALACLSSGMYYLGDDYVAVDSTTVYSVYSSAKLTAETVRLLPEFVSLIEKPLSPDDEKRFVILSAHFPDLVRTAAPIRAIALPRIAGNGEPRFVPISGARALAGLAPSSLFQQRSPSAETFRFMAGLVRRLPCYALELGSRLDAVPECIASLIDEACLAPQP